MRKLKQIELEDFYGESIEIDAKFIDYLSIYGLKKRLVLDHKSGDFYEEIYAEHVNIQFIYNEDVIKRKELKKIAKWFKENVDINILRLFYNDDFSKTIYMPWCYKDNMQNDHCFLSYNSYELLSITDNFIKIDLDEKRETKNFNIVGRISKKDSRLPCNLFILESFEKSIFTGSLRYGYDMSDNVCYYIRFQDNSDDIFEDDNYVLMRSLVGSISWPLHSQSYLLKHESEHRKWAESIAVYTKHNALAVKVLANGFISQAEFLQIANNLDDISNKKNLKDINAETIKLLSNHKAGIIAQCSDKTRLFQKFLKEEGISL